MNLSAMIDKRLVDFGFDASTKEEVIEGVARKMYEAGKVTNLEEYIDGLYKREEEFTTGIGNGIAIPHCKSDCVKDAAFTLVKLKNNVEWQSLDDAPVNYVIMLAAPNSEDNVHLKMLSRLAANLMDDDFREGLTGAKNLEEIVALFENKKED